MIDRFPATEEPPQYLASNLEDFLKPGASKDLGEIVQTTLAQLPAEAVSGQPKPKRQKGSTAVETATPKPRQPRTAKEKRASSLAAARHSQNMVRNMVKHVEEKQLLKESVFLQNIAAPDGSGTIVSWPVDTCQFVKFNA